MENVQRMEPEKILSFILTAVFEMLLIAFIIFILNVNPAKIPQDDPPITLKINFVKSSMEAVAENTSKLPDVTPIEEKTPEIVESDPLLEALAGMTFEKNPKGVTAGYRTVESKREISEIEPEGLFAIPDLFSEKRSETTIPQKKISSQNFSTLKENQKLSFNDLKTYNFPNYEEVAASLKKDYNELLKKTPKTRLDSLKGIVTVKMTLQTNGNPDVELVYSASPELANIFLKNLKLLRTGQRLEPVLIAVEVEFSFNQ